jgi:UDP-N-acetylmuramoyl-L-alanyl-D-glutamate--2,6-diaminopimelate ligase
MTIGEVLAGAPLKSELPPSLAALDIKGIEYDSRRVGPGYLFFAFAGQHADGRRFAADAIQHGAAGVVSESARPAEFSGAWIEVEQAR